MIADDCISQKANEVVMEVLEGPRKKGEYFFFLYWNGHNTVTGEPAVRGQAFVTNPKPYFDKYALRIIDRRKP